MGNITLLSDMVGFTNHATTIEKSAPGRGAYLLREELQRCENDSVCPECGGRMHVHGSYEATLRHLCQAVKWRWLHLIANLKEVAPDAVHVRQPKDINKGRYAIFTGGKYNSYLYLPMSAGLDTLSNQGRRIQYLLIIPKKSNSTSFT